MVGQELIIYPWFYWYTQSPKYTVLIVVPRMYIYIYTFPLQNMEILFSRMCSKCMS